MTQPTISDAAVQAKTGRVWAEWFTLLDAKGAAGLAHREIAVALREQHGLSGWWSQMVTVAYEQARGRREPHQTARGYQVGVSKTVPVAVDALFTAWEDEVSRQALARRRTHHHPPRHPPQVHAHHLERRPN